MPCLMVNSILVHQSKKKEIRKQEKQADEFVKKYFSDRRDYSSLKLVESGKIL